MKKILSITTLAVGGVLALASCSDFLDQRSESEMDESIYNSTYFTSLRVNQIYGGLMQDRTYAQDLAIVWNMNSDIELVDGLGNNAYNTSSERGNMNYNFDPGWARLSQVWEDMYGVIEDANDVIGKVRTSPLYEEGSAERETMGRYLGEALTLRAMLYFDLVRYFGDIPLKLDASLPDLSNAYLEKTDRDDIMDTLMVDLEEAIELLPWADEVTGYTTEHATKGYAHALLAQIAMTRAGWAIREQSKEGYETAPKSSNEYPTQRPGETERKALLEKALKHLTAVITSGRHSLNPSFENEWYLINQLTLDQTYHENIFEIPMGLNTHGELGYTVGARLNGVTSKWGYGNSTGKMKLTAPLFYSYRDNDTRRDITCSPMETKADEEDETKTKEYMLKNAPFGIYVGKWDFRKMNETWLQQNLVATAKHTTGINPVKMRYSNVLLFYAECMNELAGGPDGTYAGSAGLTARQALALVHERAYDADHKAEAQAYVASLSSDKDEFFKAIVQENAWEFAGEGFRKWDLIRWNLLVDKITEFKQTYLTQLETGVYPKKIYFNYEDEGKTEIDMSSVTFKGLPDEVQSKEYQDSIDWFGAAKIDEASEDTQVDVNLPSISSGLLNSDVYNRYIMPIGSTTISASNGKLHNSYGYND